MGASAVIMNAAQHADPYGRHRCPGGGCRRHQPPRPVTSSARVHTGQMPRPALLLDVDGVLNPYGTVQCPVGFTEYSLFPGEEPVRLCLAHGEWISELRNVFD